VGSSSDDALWRLSVCLTRTSGLSREQRGLGRLNWHRDSPRHTWLGHHFQGEKVKGQGHQAALITAALTRQAAAAVSMGTYWPWEPTVTLRSALCRRCRLGGARRFGAHRGRRGAGHIVAAARLPLVYFRYRAFVKVRRLRWRPSPPERWKSLQVICIRASQSSKIVPWCFATCSLLAAIPA